MNNKQMDLLRRTFGDRLQESVLMSGHTTSRVGGPADALLVVQSADELAEAAQHLWKQNLPFMVLGAASNVLVSDRGIRDVVIINRARQITFRDGSDPPTVSAESGTTLSDIARRAALRGFSGLEWASAVPGSLGGAVYGNAGAFGGDMAGNLMTIDLIHRHQGRSTWQAEKMAYTYRSSALKREKQPVVILGAEMKLTRSEKEAVEAKMKQYSIRRRQNQPPGASMGSVFKNPPGEHAGRLIEEAGLKGKCIGDAEISPQHANFIINRGKAKAAEVKGLIDLARENVHERFGLELITEIEFIGDWQESNG